MFSSVFHKIKNKKIGVFAPSSYIDVERFEAGLTLLHAHGFQTKVHDQCYLKDGQSAGSTADKLDAFYELIEDDEVGIIMAAAGGNRALHLLEDIDFVEARIKDKVFCGYSDFTALALGLHSVVNIPSIYGPMVQNLPNATEQDQQHFYNMISGRVTGFDMGEDIKVLKEGTAYGMLIGGTLSILPCLTGTPYMPKIKDHILFIEDCNEELSRLDRTLAHLKKALPFEKLGGLIVGDFTGLTDTGRPYGFTLEEIIAEHIDVIDGPVICNAPIGHGERLMATPIGTLGQLSVSGNQAKLSF